jgi:outer membrane protein OmpA-like peptidoglycan-associated protein
MWNFPAMGSTKLLEPVGGGSLSNIILRDSVMTEGGCSLRPSLSLALLAFAATHAGEVAYPQMIHLDGTRGLSQTRSAESLGEGFLSFGANGSWYKVDKATANTPPAKLDVAVGTFSVGLGVGSYADVSAWVSSYMVPDWKANPNKSGLGASGAQIKLQGPWDDEFPLRAALQFGINGGSDMAIQTGWTADGQARPDGWNYFQTRTGYDFSATFIQTLRAGNESFPVRVHLNEGLVSSIDADHPNLFLIDAGLELTPVSVLTLGLEAHARSLADNFDTETDPLWGTGTFTFHMPGNVNFQVGGDLRFSSSRTEADKNALDPWRLFGGLSVGFDLGAGARRAVREAKVTDSLEHERLANLIAEGEAKARRIQKSMDSAGEVARAKFRDRDTAEAHLRADSTRLAIGLALCQRDGSSARSQVARMNDSLARRSSQDSMALADARRQIEEERLKRGDLEATFLKTGMMNLDAVYFDLGKATITANSKPYLNLIGTILVKYPKLKFEIGGHTDNRGQPKANQKLSQSRAQAVLNQLTSINPDLASHIAAKGYGDTKPKATNKTAEGREMNRRVEITVTNIEALKEYTK